MIFNTIIAASVGALFSLLGILLNNWLNYKNKIKSDAYNNFMIKRIDAYNEFHKQLMLAFGLFYSTYEFGSKPDFNEFSLDDIKTYLKERKVLEGNIRKFSDIWENESKSKAIGKIVTFLTKGEPNIVENEITKALNIYVQNIFYFSENVGNIANELTKKMLSYNDEKQMIRIYGRSKLEKEKKETSVRIRKLKENIEKLKTEFIETTRNEIKQNFK